MFRAEGAIGEMRLHPAIKPSELLYQTSDPCETPLVMPTWARKVPILAAKIDAGYELHRRGHEIAAERGITTCCPVSHAWPARASE